MATSALPRSTQRRRNVTKALQLKPKEVAFLRSLKKCSGYFKKTFDIREETEQFSGLSDNRQCIIRGQTFKFLQDIRKAVDEGNVDTVLKEDGSLEFLERVNISSSLVLDLGLDAALNQLRQKNADAIERQQRRNRGASPEHGNNADDDDDEGDNNGSLLVVRPLQQHYCAIAQMNASSSSYQNALPAAATNDDIIDDDVVDFGDEAAVDNPDIVLSHLERDVLPNLIGTIQLTDAQLEMLAASHAVPQITIKRMIQHLAVHKLWPHADTTAFLKMVRNNKPIGLDSEQFPLSSKTLLNIKDVITETGVRIRSLYTITKGIGIAKHRVKTGIYLHFGIKSALLAKSAGLVSKWQYIKAMRVVHTLFPDVIPDEILAIVKPQPGEESDKELLKHWARNPPKPYEGAERKIVFNIHGHIDGVQWFTNSTQSKGVPILGRLVSIADLESGKTIKIPELDPFVIGVLHVLKTTNTHEFVKDFVTELRELLFPDIAGLSFQVKMTALICDAPQRAECKGITFFNGYSSCERCIVKGEQVVQEKSKNKKKIVRLTELDCALRKDADWDKYRKPDTRVSIFLYIISKYIHSTILEIISSKTCSHVFFWYILYA